MEQPVTRQCCNHGSFIATPLHRSTHRSVRQVPTPRLQLWTIASLPQIANHVFELSRAAGGVGHYGETLWLVGAASDGLSAELGADDPCCGHEDTGRGGCGKCVLARAQPGDARDNLTAIIMKKSRCPPSTNLCGDGRLHMDIAAPGFDYAAESTASVCGSSQRETTYLSAAESQVCATSTWTTRPAAATSTCCAALYDDGTPARRMLRRGCDLFVAWGWYSGTPTLEYRVVPCPTAFTSRIAAAFNAAGVAPTAFPIAASTPMEPPQPPAAPAPPDTLRAPPPDSQPKDWVSPPPPRPPSLPPAWYSPTPSHLLGLVAAVVVATVVCLVWGRHWLPTCGRARPAGRHALAGSSQQLRVVASKRVTGQFDAGSATGSSRLATSREPSSSRRSATRHTARSGCTRVPSEVGGLELYDLDLDHDLDLRAAPSNELTHPAQRADSDVEQPDAARAHTAARRGCGHGANRRDRPRQTAFAADVHTHQLIVDASLLDFDDVKLAVRRVFKQAVRAGADLSELTRPAANGREAILIMTEEALGVADGWLEPQTQAVLSAYARLIADFADWQERQQQGEAAAGEVSESSACAPSPKPAVGASLLKPAIRSNEPCKKVRAEPGVGKTPKPDASDGEQPSDDDETRQAKSLAAEAYAYHHKPAPKLRRAISVDEYLSDPAAPGPADETRRERRAEPVRSP